MWNFPNRNYGLDVIRATAIVLVVLSHCTFILPEFNSQLTDAIRLLGATGVDIFFVLSGYLIGGILLRKLKTKKTRFSDLVHFWKRRWLRTLPNYFVVLILNILLILFFGNGLVNEVWLYIPFLQNFTSPHPDFFTEAWSLSIEEYAYLILPFIIYTLLFLFQRVRASKVFLFSTIIVIFVLFIFKFQFYYSIEIGDYKDWSSKFRKVLLYRLDAIYYGFVMVYLVSKYQFFKSKKNTLLITSGCLFITLHAMIVILDMSPNDYKLFYSIFYLPLISLGIAIVFPWFLKLKAKSKLSKIITYISKRSYAIYLVNYSIVLLTLKYFLNPSVLMVLVYLITTLLFSELLYRLVEIPILRLRERLVPRR